VNYGVAAPKPRAITIPSVRHFTDFRVNGSLHVILETFLECCTVRDLMPLDSVFQQPAAVLLPILCEVEKNLAIVSQSFLHAICLSLI
jgi:hypothetical protein